MLLFRQMERRSFFAVLAAPLLRRFAPPTPIGSIVIDGKGFPVGYRERDSAAVILKALSVEDAQLIIDRMFPERA